jgi:hypothetical protein
VNRNFCGKLKHNSAPLQLPVALKEFSSCPIHCQQFLAIALSNVPEMKFRSLADNRLQILNTYYVHQKTGALTVSTDE